MMDPKLFKLLDRVLDLEYGIIRYIKEIPLMPDEPDIFIAITEFQDPFIVSQEGESRKRFQMGKQSAGAALDRVSAIWSAIGEGIERYAGAIYDPQLITWAASNELDNDSFVDPNDFILFSRDQYNDPNFKYEKHDPKIPIGWTIGKRLGDQKNIYFPASLAYFAYDNKHKSEFLTDSYSTGLACGPTEEWAVCSGLYEVIERDAYALHWAARQPAKKIDLDQAIACASPDLQKLLQHEGVDLFLGDITTELGVPTILVIAKHPDKPGIALGASTNLCAKTALRKAVVECFHTFNWCIEMHRWNKRVEEQDVKAFSDHVLYYLQEGREHQAEFFWSSTERSTLLDGLEFTPSTTPDHVHDQKTIVNLLDDLGHPSYVIDISPEDVASLGLRVTRAVIPSLQPMWCGFGRVPLDRRRFNQFLAYKEKDLNTPINQEIHPFP